MSAAEDVNILKKIHRSVVGGVGDGGVIVVVVFDVVDVVGCCCFGDVVGCCCWCCYCNVEKQLSTAKDIIKNIIKKILQIKILNYILHFPHF